MPSSGEKLNEVAMIWQSAKCCACRRHNFARHGSRQRREERFDVLLGQLPAAVTAALQHAGGQLGLARLQLADTFLDGAAGDQTIDEHRLVLPDAIGAVGSLVLGSGFHQGS